MLNRASVIELRDGFLALARQVSSGDGTLHSEVREKIRVAVQDLRLLGWPPERVIIAVKQIAQEAGLHASNTLLTITADRTPNEAAVQQVVRCCIEDYYGPRPV